ncbi:MAG: hypothetical protein A2202_05120 [Bdellovibrionales bacterium RIFOXYA1_FULL_36_14]|nr:MAG: hypothetical protein A2202_05120 [Bdellovibrionales bacterium RIFOXYA1_FULL_36_14]
MNNSGQTQIQLPHLTKVNKILIIAVGSIFILQSLLSKALGINLMIVFGLSANLFFKGLVYQLLSYPFLATGLMEVIFGGLILWFLGSELESSWGTKRYLSFMGVSYVGAGLVYLFISSLFFKNNLIYSYPLIGLQGITNAMCLAYGIIYPNRTFLFMLIFPMKTKYFCALLVLIQVYMGVIESNSVNGVLAWGHLAAMLFGFLYLLTISSRSFKDLMDKLKKRKSTAKLTVLYGEKKSEDKTPKYWQ